MQFDIRLGMQTIVQEIHRVVVLEDGDAPDVVFHQAVEPEVGQRLQRVRKELDSSELATFRLRLAGKLAESPLTVEVGDATHSACPMRVL